MKFFGTENIKSLDYTEIRQRRTYNISMGRTKRHFTINQNEKKALILDQIYGTNFVGFWETENVWKKTRNKCIMRNDQRSVMSKIPVTKGNRIYDRM